MDDILPVILRGCELVRQVEAQLQGGAENTTLLRASCQEISRLFGAAAERLRHREASSLFAGQAMELVAGQVPEEVQFQPLARAEAIVVRPPDVSMEVPTAISAVGVQEVRPAESSGGQRSSRKRKDGDNVRTVRFPAPRTGNLDLPPDDGYTWRKYGQKDILNAKFPRSYYRCTHKSFYGCDAKKQVQRLDNEPFTFEVTYCGEHTCLTSTTPLVLPAITVEPPPQPQAVSWAAATGGASSSQVHGGRDMEWPVADMAEAMFNVGTRGTVGMDAIFQPQRQEK